MVTMESSRMSKESKSLGRGQNGFRVFCVRSGARGHAFSVCVVGAAGRRGCEAVRAAVIEEQSYASWRCVSLAPAVMCV